MNNPAAQDTPTPTGLGNEDPRKRRPLRTILGVALAGVLLLFVIHSIWTQWGDVRAYEWKLHAGWLVLSAVLMWVDLIGLILLYRWLLVDIARRPLSFPQVYRASMLANLGKYIPGKIWSVMGLVYLLRREGYPAPATLSSALLHQAYMIVAGAGFFWVILGTEFLINVPAIAVVIGLGGCLLMLYPPVFSFLLNRGLRLLGRDPVQIPRSFVRAVVRLFLYVAAWIAYGASSYCLLRGLGIDATAFWEITAIFGAAYLVGFLALFAPGGLGVRESIITLLLASYLPGGLPAAIAVAARFWTTIVELLGLIPILGQIRKPDNTDEPP